MCSFGSCQTRFEFLSQFRKVRNAFECFVTQVQTQLPKTKRVWPMKINVICTVCQRMAQSPTNHRVDMLPYFRASAHILVSMCRFCCMYHTQQHKVTITIIKRLKNIYRWKKARCGYLGNKPCVLLMREGIYSEQLTSKYRC